LESAILDLLTGVPRGATVCPSEAAQRVFAEAGVDRLEDARAAARRLVARGEVDLVQQGRIVDASTAKGPFRIRRTLGNGTERDGN